MPTYTPNYNLKKPAGDEFYNIADHNSNMDAIDAALKSVEEYVDEKTGDLDDHIANTSNPHGVTAAQVGAPTLLSRTYIPENADLDSYLTPGSYCAPTNARAQTLSNAPFTSAFTMEVFYATGASSYIGQEVRQYNNGITAYRFYSVSTATWSSWHTRYSTANKPTAADIGALDLSGGTLTGSLSMASPFVVRQDSLTKGTVPSSTTYINVQLTDKNGNGSVNRLGALEAGVTTAGVVVAKLMAYNYTNGNNDHGDLIVYNDYGDCYATAPDAAPGTKALRNMYATTNDLTAGTSALATGVIALVYE